MNHKMITKFVLGIFMVASLGLSGMHGHTADMNTHCQTSPQACAS